MQEIVFCSTWRGDLGGEGRWGLREIEVCEWDVRGLWLAGGWLVVGLCYVCAGWVVRGSFWDVRDCACWGKIGV